MMSASNQIPCYLINLERSHDRLQSMHRLFAERGLQFERVPAMDGALLSDEDVTRLTVKRHWVWELSRAEIGCFLSHRECLRRIAEGDAPWGAVFEDDIALSPQMSRFLHDWNWIPAGTEMVKLDTGNVVCTVEPPRAIVWPEATPSGYSLARLVSAHCCAGGYLVSKQCATRLYALTADIRAPIDEIYFNLDYGLLRELNVQQMIPALVVQVSGLASTIEAQRRHNRSIARRQRTLGQCALRNLRRVHRKYVLPRWLALTRGYQVGKIGFQ